MGWTTCGARCNSYSAAQRRSTGTRSEILQALQRHYPLTKVPQAHRLQGVHVEEELDRLKGLARERPVRLVQGLIDRALSQRTSISSLWKTRCT